MNSDIREKDWMSNRGLRLEDNMSEGPVINYGEVYLPHGVCECGGGGGKLSLALSPGGGGG